MDSSFLTVIHVGIGIYAVAYFIKLLIQFGLPNHPSRFLCYLVCSSVTSYFVALAATDLGYLSPWIWEKWRTLPLVAGSLCLLFQVIALIGNFSLIQQKIISRLPLIGALLCFALFQSVAGYFATGFILVGALFLIVSVGKARYQKRQYLKMGLFLTMWFALRLSMNYWAFIVAEIFLTFALFYLFVFEQATSVAALVSEIREEGEIV